jgi:TIR domain
MVRPAIIFFSYAHEDEALMNRVRQQLIIFERQGYIIKYYDRMIPPGGEWQGVIDNMLFESQIILLFVSPDFIESRYCYDIEVTAALERHRAGAARVIPVILRPCAWTVSPFGQLQALPTNGKPITTWRNLDKACLDVAEGVMQVVSELSESPKDN